MDVKEKEKKLVQKTQHLKISALTAANEESVKPAFAFQRLYYSAQSTNFPQTSGTASVTGTEVDTAPTKGKRPGKAQPKTKNAVIHSDISSDQRQVICGLANDWIAELDPQVLSTSPLSVANCSFKRRHVGLSHICCSKVSSSIFYSSSAVDGTIYQWDTRVNGQSKPLHMFNLNNSKIQSPSAGVGVKPILTCDANSSDQLLCGGTELVQGQEDCYLLFWDVRNASELLGAYWESHSDDVTTVRFHPEESHVLCSGSTDGLLNVFNLLETTEDDALQYSFNTESSVDSITWRSSADAQQNGNHIVALTHTNEVQVWDTHSGDSISAFSREQIARAMETKASDPDSVHLVGCHRAVGQNLKLVASSLSGDFAKILELGQDNKLQTKGIFSDDSCVLQSTCYLQEDDRWVTFDESGVVKLWSSTPSLKTLSPTSAEDELKSKEKRSSARFAPYNTRGADKRK